MTETEALKRMIAPGIKRPGKYRQGVIQVWVTRACDKACYGCTQGSNLAGRPEMITPDQYEAALQSLAGYWGVVGMFGGNPATHPNFEGLCELLCKYVPFEQRGLWCNSPMGKGKIMRKVFNPAVSNLNVHLDAKAYAEFKRDWPECSPVGLQQDSRHSPPFVAMKDLEELTEGERWALIADCDINKHWSALIGVFRGEVRAWFCEVAGAQAMLHQHEPDYPDTGVSLMFERVMGPDMPWWKLGMIDFQEQVRKHCHECGVPLRGHGELAQARAGKEQTSVTHAAIYQPKRDRRVELVVRREQLGEPVGRVIDYLKNGVRHSMS